MTLHSEIRSVLDHPLQQFLTEVLRVELEALILKHSIVLAYTTACVNLSRF